MMVGKTGSGKTLISKQILFKLDQNKNLLTFTCLNATTTPSQLQ